jgi:hypothetical protein
VASTIGKQITELPVDAQNEEFLSHNKLGSKVAVVHVQHILAVGESAVRVLLMHSMYTDF